MWTEKKCDTGNLLCNYIGKSKPSYYAHIKICKAIMNDYTKSPGIANLNRMFERPTAKNVRAIYEGAVDEERAKIRQSIAIFETQKKELDKKYLEFKEKATTLKGMKKVMNEVDDEDYQSSSPRGSPPSKKQKEEGVY
jgi:hypothetical protein